MRRRLKLVHHLFDVLGQTILSSKPDLKGTLITTLEAASFGGVIIVSDFVDEKAGLDQTTLKSVSNALPIVVSLVSTAGTMFTKGGAKLAMRDVQLMSTPFAIISITRVLRARGVFGNLFKKKRSSLDEHKKEHFGPGQSGREHQINDEPVLGDASFSDIG